MFERAIVRLLITICNQVFRLCYGVPPSYERRTGAVRPLWVFGSSLAFHTGGMSRDPDFSKRSTYDVLTSAAAAPTGQTFEDVVLPHLDAAYRLARWLVANEHDAEDIVQEACLRSLRYFQSYNTESSNLPQLMAASIVALLPCLIVFFVAQRNLVQGVVVTGVKG